jgi:hypothetical protein
MKNLLFAIISLYVFESYSKTLFEETQSTHDENTSPKEQIIREKKKIIYRTGNLPKYARLQKKLNIKINKVTESETDGSYVLSKLKVGDEYRVFLNSIIYGIEGSKIKISGYILNGPAMGAGISGYTELEPFSKKVLVRFDRIILKSGEVFDFESSLGTDTDYFIQPDKYISKKSRFLTGYVLSAFASSFLQSKVQVNSTFFGNQAKNNTKNAGYLGAAKGVETISEEFESALKNSKDVAYVTSKLEYSLSILSQPKLIK